MSDKLTKKQEELVGKHGLPTDFEKAVMAACPGFISIEEAKEAIQKYRMEFYE